jgi:hypothetical protein
MKRIVVFAGVLALLAGMVLVPYLTDDAQAQSRVKIRPFLTPWCTTSLTVAGADVNVLATPSSSLRGFSVACFGDTTIGDTAVVTIYHESGDSTALTMYPTETGAITIPFPNVRVTGFRIDIDPAGVLTADAGVTICGWY